MIPRPTTRLLALLELLQARDRISGSELARRLEINDRSVRRYLAMLEEIGIPVETIRGPHGGYRLRPGYKLPPLIFTDDEAVVLTLALAGLNRLGVALDPAVVAATQAKLERVLPLTLRERAQALEGGLAFDPAPPSGAIAGGLLNLLGQAAGQGQRVHLRYRSEEGVETTRDVDPYGVVRWSHAWYLVGHCHLRGGTRLFRLDRIVTAEPLAAHFTPPAGFDSYAYVAQAMVAYPGRWTIELLLDLTPEEARATTLMTYGTLTPHNQGVHFIGRFDDLTGVARWLTTFRCPLQVLHPPELRTALRQLSEEIAAMADGHVSPGE